MPGRSTVLELAAESRERSEMALVDPCLARAEDDRRNRTTGVARRSRVAERLTVCQPRALAPSERRPAAGCEQREDRSLPPGDRRIGQPFAGLELAGPITLPQVGHRSPAPRDVSLLEVDALLPRSSTCHATAYPTRDEGPDASRPLRVHPLGILTPLRRLLRYRAMRSGRRGTTMLARGCSPSCGTRGTHGSPGRATHTASPPTRRRWTNGAMRAWGPKD